MVFDLFWWNPGKGVGRFKAKKIEFQTLKIDTLNTITKQHYSLLLVLFGRTPEGRIEKWSPKSNSAISKTYKPIRTSNFIMYLNPPFLLFKAPIIPDCKVILFYIESSICRKVRILDAFAGLRK